MRRAILAFLGLVLACTPSAFAAKRVALVIGNDDYSQVPKLQKAVNDAKAIGTALEGIGFTVLRAENLTRREMNRQLQSFASRLEAGDEAVFFFAGHGVEIAGRNYLLPTDVPAARPGQEDFVKAEAIPVDQVLDTIRSRGTRVSILVLDACRDNPFPKVGTRSLGGSRGLARMPAPEGTFIMYSAGVGQTALDRLSNDDPNPNSVFTRSLIPLMQKPGMSLVQAARAVRRDVQKLAATVPHDQRPAYYDEVTGDFFFAGRGKTPPPAATLQPAPVNPALAAWTAVQDSDSVAVLEEFLKQFPKGIYAELAKARLRKLKETKVAVGIFPKPEAKAEPKPGEEFQDCDICPKMVVIPAGRFTMGSPPGEKDHSDDEGPQRKVTIPSAFAVGKFEVTRDQFEAFVNDSGYDAASKCWTNENNEFEHRTGRSFRNPGFFKQGGNEPVVCINWDDAKAYVAWLSKKTGKTYRLLSEAEWEYAARAGTTTPFSTGRTITTDQANFNGNYTYNGSHEGQYRQKTVSVGSFTANGFGLHDMHGNVEEWVEDCESGSYRGAPSNGSAWTTEDCGYRVYRGGHWDSAPWNLRSAKREEDPSEYGEYSLGLRVARRLSP